MDRVRATRILWSSVGALTSDVRPQTNAHNVKEPQELKKRIDSVELFCTVRERWGCAPSAPHDTLLEVVVVTTLLASPASRNCIFDDVQQAA